MTSFGALRFDVMQSVANQGLISDPRGKFVLVRVTLEGMVRAKP